MKNGDVFSSFKFSLPLIFPYIVHRLLKSIYMYRLQIVILLRMCLVAQRKLAPSQQISLPLSLCGKVKIRRTERTPYMIINMKPVS